MSMVRMSDADFRVCRVSFDELVALQARAERCGFATRWSSIEALRGQVRERDVFLRPLLREERDGALRAYRCLVLFAAAHPGRAGGVVTLDVEPSRFANLHRVDTDPESREALASIFVLATGGIDMMSKADAPMMEESPRIGRRG